VLIENGVGKAYGTSDAQYSTDVLAAKAVRFIAAGRADQPFFLYFAPNAPHFPSTPAARHAGRFTDVSAWRPPAFAESDVSDKPAWLRALEFGPAQEAFADAFRVGQLESLLAVDEAVGAILRAVRATGRERETVIVFTSDNGHLWGEHRVVGKACAYEEAIRVPLVIRHPALAPLGRHEDRFALNIDLAPTLLELAGVPVPADAEGRSLVRVLDATEREWRDDFLIEAWQGDSSPVPDFAGVRTARWKWVEYATGERELYDLEQDPDELVSRDTNPATEAVRRGLATRLRELRPDWGR
jgi:arylsulfatase A-like enzyme